MSEQLYRKRPHDEIHNEQCGCEQAWVVPVEPTDDRVWYCEPFAERWTEPHPHRPMVDILAVSEPCAAGSDHDQGNCRWLYEDGGSDE